MSTEIKLCPIIQATVKDFANFEQYMEKLENQYSGEYGMVKVNFNYNYILNLLIIKYFYNN